MERQEHSQLELFSQGREQRQVKSNPGFSSAFLNYISNYERIILIIIGFVITGIISFCLGVERGKTIVMPRIDSHFDIAQDPGLKSPSSRMIQNQKPVAPVIISSEIGLSAKQTVKPIPEKNVVILKTQLQSKGFTIQLACYGTRTNAERETESLKKKGFLPLILSKGGYNVVCVGNFSNMETAKSSLSKLRQNYRDCYIRRL